MLRYCFEKLNLRKLITFTLKEKFYKTSMRSLILWCFLFSFLLYFPINSIAENTDTTINKNCKINGRVLSSTKAPIEYVAVTLLNKSDSSLVKGDLTDSNGVYLIEGIEPGGYLINISYVGYIKIFTDTFRITDGQSIDIRDILLSETDDNTGVTITAILPLFEQKPGMLVMNVENSPIRIAGTALDVLSKAPGVFVDQNGNITLKGKGGVKIYIDGRPTYLNGDQLSTYLQSIPASDIVRVEIISNPSAKYDAEGSGGIINIVTRKGAQQGFNGIVRGGFSYARLPKENGGISFNYGKEKYNLYGRYNFAHWLNDEKDFITRNVLYDDTTTTFDQYSYSKNSPFAHSITWGGRINGSFVHSFNKVNDITNITRPGEYFQQLDQRNVSQDENDNGSVGAFYKQSLDTSGQEISFSSDYLVYDNSSFENFNLKFLNSDGSSASSPVYQRSNSATLIKIFVNQADYTLPVRKKYKLETGIKSSFVGTENSLVFEIMDTTGNVMRNDTTRSNEFIYKEIINAAYVNGSAEWKKYQVMAGIRVEQTISDGNSPTTNQNLHKSYFQLFPSVFITQELKNENHVMNYSYARRITRPNYGSLNPFKFYLDQYTYEMGNPYLQPQISNNLEVSYGYHNAAFLTMGASRTLMAMTEVTHQIDSINVTYLTTVNLNTVDNGYLGLSFTAPVTKWWTTSNNFSMVYQRFQSNLYGSEVDNRTWLFNASSNHTFILPKNWKLEVWAWYRSSTYFGIFNLAATGSVNAGVTKMMLDKRLRLTVNVFDIFLSQNNKTTITFQGQDVTRVTIPETRRVFIGFIYSFGNQKAERKVQFKNSSEELQDRTVK
jgi:hypothetical protein